MTLVALYARYSSDNQREASIEDQFRICREQAKSEKWRVVGTYKDAGISGASMILRPGIQMLLQDAQAGQFDMVLAEALDRISREQADVATLFKHLKFAGVPIVTLAEGEISELHVGLKGTMNALFLKDLAAKTHRGIRGRVEDGKSGGGLCYGYKVVKKLDSRGDPIRGDREIDAAEANVVRRILRDYVAGVSPRVIAKTLNEEGVPGPEARLWNDTTIHGYAKRGTGILNNELYIGRLIWNRLRYLKDPSTGKRVSRLNPEWEWTVKDVPELRIVDYELWQSVKARQAVTSAKYANVAEGVRAHHKRNRLNGTHRPKTLLSGLVFCGCCGGPYSLRGADRFACSNHISKGSCSNSRGIAREELERRVLAGLKDRMMAPEIVEDAMRAYAEETNRLNRERRSNGDSWKAELVKVEKQIAQIVEAIADGMYHPSMKEKMTGLEARREELTGLLADAPADTPDILPSASAIYAKKVVALTKALNHKEERQEASQDLRALIEKIVLTPSPERGELYATLHGELRTILEWTERQAVGKSAKMTKSAALATGLLVSVVAGARIGHCFAMSRALNLPYQQGLRSSVNLNASTFDPLFIGKTALPHLVCSFRLGRLYIAAKKLPGGRSGPVPSYLNLPLLMTDVLCERLHHISVYLHSFPPQYRAEGRPKYQNPIPLEVVTTSMAVARSKGCHPAAVMQYLAHVGCLGHIASV